MKKRCLTPSDRAYRNYGGRGIKVCKRWLKFENFLEDMGEQPEGLQLERVNNSLGYSKRNCKWVTSKEQNNNRRFNRMISIGGVSKSLAYWLVAFRLTDSCVYYRVKYKHWTFKKALTTAKYAK
jgi:hypothetical protein